MANFVTSDLNTLFALSLMGLCLCLIFNLRQVSTTILALTPFQFIETRFGSNSIYLILTVGIIFLLRKQLSFKFTKYFAPLFIAYVIGIIFATNDTLVLNLTVLLSIVSCWFVFELSFNLAVSDATDRVIKLLLFLNVLILCYCGIQLVVGTTETVSPFGLENLALHSNRGADDARLIGPFGTPATTAGYFCLMNILIIGLYKTHRINSFVGMIFIGLNSSLLFATGSRGALIVCGIGMIAVAALVADSRRPIAIQIFSFVALMLVIGLSVQLVIQKSEFTVMADRLQNVFDTVDELPATRAKVWTDAFERIQISPWTGEGPYYVSYDAAEPLGRLKTLYDDYPHSLVLFVLRTTGIIGLVAFVWLFSCLINDAMKARSNSTKYSASNIFARLFLIAIAAFLANELRIEFIRPSTMDYAHFIFMFFGSLLGLAHRRSDTDTKGRVM